MSYYISCSTNYGGYQDVTCPGSGIYCCCYYDTLMNNPYCCNCNNNALLWWAWVLISLAIAVFVFFFVCLIVCCVRRRRRLLTVGLPNQTVMVGMDSTRNGPMIVRQPNGPPGQPVMGQPVYYWKRTKKIHKAKSWLKETLIYMHFTFRKFNQFW